MSPMLSTLLFAASAAAQLTTTIWMPSKYSKEEVGFYGSIIGVDGDRTTVAMVYDNDTDTSMIGVPTNTPETFTVASTYFGVFITTIYNWDDTDLTMSLACSLKTQIRAKPTCTYSLGGEAVFSSYCSDYSSYTDVVTHEYSYTSDEFGPATIVTRIKTYGYSEIPGFCSTGSTVPDDYAIQTFTPSRDDLKTYQLVITAGQDKLKATAGATPTGTGAQPTGSDASGSGANSSPTGTAAASAAGTGAAIPVMTMAPALAGLGVAMAALVL